MLHLIFQSPLDSAVLERIAVGDEVIFLENAVLRLLKNSVFSAALTQQLTKNRLYVLADDLLVRGLNATDLVAGIEVITYAQWVDLTIKNTVIQSWT